MSWPYDEDDENSNSYSSVGKDPDGNDDGSWWGSRNSPSKDPDNDGGTHHTMHGTDDSRTSWETDKNDYYVPGSGHTTNSDGSQTQWDNESK